LLRRTLSTHALARTVHNEREWAKRPLRRLILTNFICPLMFDIELGVSQQVVNNLNQRPLPRLLGRRAQVMYNSLDFRRFQNRQIDQAAKRAELGITPDALVIGSVGRLTRQKGYDILLHSIPTVLAHRPEVFFLIAGEGEMQNQLQAEAVQLGVDHAVRFLGRRTDVEDLLEVFDLFVSSSRWEGLPTVLLESIAAGLPIVATKVSGTVELIKNGVNGLLVPPENARSLAASIISVLSDLDRYRHGANQMQHEIQNVFSIKIIADKHEDLYRTLLAAKKS
jgi:glycosyltransferase involved in cell wall biosynthesis